MVKITEEVPVEVSVHRSSIDGALVVQVDTTGDTGDLRVNLNDGMLWDGNPEYNHSPLDGLNQIRALVNGISDAMGPNAAQEQAKINAQFRAQVSVLLYGDKWRESIHG